jgi:hypothetical protein
VLLLLEKLLNFTLELMTSLPVSILSSSSDTVFSYSICVYLEPSSLSTDSLYLLESLAEEQQLFFSHNKILAGTHGRLDVSSCR